MSPKPVCLLTVLTLQGFTPCTRCCGPQQWYTVFAVACMRCWGPWIRKEGHPFLRLHHETRLLSSREFGVSRASIRYMIDCILLCPCRALRTVQRAAQGGSPIVKSARRCRQHLSFKSINNLRSFHFQARPRARSRSMFL